MRVTPYVLLVMSLLAGGALPDPAHARTVEAGDATASWTGKGVIDDLEDGDSVFSGTITGTMFIRHSEGAPGHALVHAAKIDCQTVILISEKKQEQHSALCVMTAHEGKDTAYAEMRCTGKKDDCRGEFTFTYGRGGFKGITGKTPFVGGINPNPKIISQYQVEMPASGVANGAPHRAQRKGTTGGMGGVSTVGLFAATGPAELRQQDKIYFRIRVNIEQRSEGRIYGYAHWPKLTYHLP